MTEAATEVSGLTVGTAITSREQLTALPVGAVLRAGDRYTLTKRDDGQWLSSSSGMPMSNDNLDLNGYNVIESIPASASTVSVGTVIDSGAVRDSLPVGTVLVRADNSDRDTRYEVREADGSKWLQPIVRNTEGARHLLSATRVDGFLKVGEVPATGPQVGDAITSTDQVAALPVGSVLVSSRTGRTYTRQDDGRWMGSNGRRHSGTFSTSGYISVQTVGQASESEPPIDYDVKVDGGLALETIEHFKQRFRTVTMAAACRAGVNREPLRTAYDILNVEEHDLSPGMWCDPSDADAFGRLPVGTVLIKGSPHRLQHFGIHGYTANRGWLRLLGQASLSGLHKVETIPGIEAAAYVGEGTADDLAAIQEFKVRAWEVGVKAKQDNRWCGDYEAAMMQMGIDANARDRELQVLTPDEVAALPEGSVLRWTNWTESILLRRDDKSTNPARTVQLGGTTPGHWADRLALVGQPGETLAIPVHSHDEMREMPIGTVVSEGGANWNKTGVDEWREGRQGYRYNSHSFGIGSLRYTVIP